MIEASNSNAWNAPALISRDEAMTTSTAAGRSTTGPLPHLDVRPKTLTVLPSPAKESAALPVREAAAWIPREVTPDPVRIWSNVALVVTLILALTLSALMGG